MKTKSRRGVLPSAALKLALPDLSVRMQPSRNQGSGQDLVLELGRCAEADQLLLVEVLLEQGLGNIQAQRAQR